MNQTVTQAYIFAVEYAKGVAQEMLLTIQKTSKRMGLITAMVLTVTTPHQISYLLARAPMRWELGPAGLEALAMLAGCFLMPLIVDLLIIALIRICATRGMARDVKKLALVAMALPVGISEYVNVAAAPDLMFRIVFGAIVLVIPVGEGIRAIIKPDFAEIDKYERELATQIVVEATPETQGGRAKLDPEEARRRHLKGLATKERNKLAQMTPAQRRKYRQDQAKAQAAESDEIDQMVREWASGDAPVSPGAPR